MANVRVKICGIRNAEEAMFAVAEGADALGFVFAPGPRRLNIKEAAAITLNLPPFVSRVGVFVNEDYAVVKETAEVCCLDVLQFHGNESSGYCRRFSEFKIIKAFSAQRELTPAITDEFSVTAILMDTKYADKNGGGGIAFDWQLALPFSGRVTPLILAGGLTVENVYEALETVNPYAVDVSSGVEGEVGKEREKIKAFIREVRRFNR